MHLLSLLLFTLGMSQTVFGQTNVAVVKLLRGDVDLVTKGKTSKLKADDWVSNGAVIKTAEKSFVKLVFVDKSQMNVGPNSEMKIEKFTGKDSGVIDLVKGKIRSQVTKDYLQIKDKDKSKLFIKTNNAVMGIRGTDFMISTNGASTSVVLFEGEVVFNKLENRSETRTANLEDMVDKGVRMFPGEFSVMEVNRPQPTIPSLLNIQQRESLEKNDSFESDRAPGNAGKEDSKSVVPDGLTGKIVSSSSEVLKNDAKAPTDPSNGQVPASQDPDGYVKGDAVKPANGSFVHIDSGVIIPPGPGSVLDSNTNTYIPGQSSGRVASDGSYVPPKNVEITFDGKIMIAVTDTKGNTIVQEVERPVPVVSVGNVPLASVGTVIRDNPGMLNPKGPVTNDILNSNYAPSGLNDLSNQQRNVSGGINTVNDAVNSNTHTKTTIIIQPR
ncbi:MAG TPA: FecR family protein [Bacteriovoracaceae bacterium]|nr:FecR family protein [Bacteriovoracaceae bacterium]